MLMATPNASIMLRCTNYGPSTKIRQTTYYRDSTSVGARTPWYFVLSKCSNVASLLDLGESCHLVVGEPEREDTQVFVRVLCGVARAHDRYPLLSHPT